MNDGGQIGAAVATWWRGWIAGNIDPLAERRGNARVLRHGWRMRASMNFCLALFGVPLLACPFFMPWTLGDLGLVFGVVGLAWALAVHAALTSRRYRIEWDAESLRVISPWKRPREFRLADLTDWYWSFGGESYVLTTDDGRRLRVSSYLNGADELHREVRRRKLAAAAATSPPPGSEPRRPVRPPPSPL